MLFLLQNASETIDFREYIIGLSLISQPASSDETIKLAFQVCQALYIKESSMSIVLTLVKKKTE